MKNAPTRSSMLFMLIAWLLIGCGSSQPPLNMETSSEQYCADSRYIILSNPNTSTTILRNWIIEDARSRLKHVLPDIVLPPHSSVYVWSGTGTNDPQNIFVGRNEDFWDVKNGIAIGKESTGFFDTIELYFLGGQECYPALGIP